MKSFTGRKTRKRKMARKRKGIINKVSGTETAITKVIILFGIILTATTGTISDNNENVCNNNVKVIEIITLMMINITKSNNYDDDDDNKDDDNKKQ